MGQIHTILKPMRNHSRAYLFCYNITQPATIHQSFWKGQNLKPFKYSNALRMSAEERKHLANYLESKISDSVLQPPASVRGMTCLDRKAFTKKVVVPHVCVSSENIFSAITYFKKLLLKLENMKPVQTTEDENKKVLLLNPVLVENIDDIKNKYLEQGGEADFYSKEIILCYDNWKAEDIIRSVVPENQEGAHSYSMIGHILHLNLRDHLLPYKTVIGEVLLEKTRNTTLVVNKTNIIDSTYRNFEMEILAGSGETNVTVKENGCSFWFDFAKVYWNPRLGTEHERILKKLKHGDVLYDVMAGVGPFTVPAARKKCRVLANDLNPHSYEALLHNCSGTKIKDRVKCYNLDGHEFIKTILKEDLLKTWKDSHFCGSVHITMNLPAMAVEFLPCYVGIFSEENNVPENVTLPILHVYMFTKEADDNTAIGMVAEKLGYIATQETSVDITDKGSSNSINSEPNEEAAEAPKNFGALREHIVEVVNVRAVAPSKVMMRVSLKLPLEILLDSSILVSEPPHKKMKES